MGFANVFSYLKNTLFSAPVFCKVRGLLTKVSVIHTEFAMKAITDLWAILFPNKLLDRTISHLIQYSRACGSYHDFLGRKLLLTRKLLNQGFLVVKMNSSRRTFYTHQQDLVNRYGVYVSQMTTGTFHLS